MGIGNRLPPKPQEIRFLLIPVLGDIQGFTRPKLPGSMYDWLRQNIGPLFDEGFEHVSVLYQGNRRDMFVGETSAMNGRHIRNVRATGIYRANAWAQHLAKEREIEAKGRKPVVRFDPESLPAISGPAVLFPDEIVWK